MVFRSRPYRQSTYLSAETTSVARAEFQQDIVDLLPKFASLAKCTNCKVIGDTIYFDDNGVFELDVTPLLPYRIAILSLVVDRDRAPVGLTVNYEVALTRSPFDGSPEYATLFQGKLAVLDPSDGASRFTSRLQVPVTGGVVLRLSASRVALPLKYLILSAIRTNINYTIVLPFPSTVTGDLTSMWRLPIQPQRFVVYFCWNSADGNTATVSYIEAGAVVSTFSTTSTTTITNSVHRFWRRDTTISFSASSNAVVKALYIDFLVSAFPLLPVKAVQSSYSTTSTSYVRYTPLSLSTVLARIRRIVVTASSNAKWYVNVNGNTVLSLTWGTSIDFNPLVEVYSVDLYLASADGANATASIIIIYDEVPTKP